MDIENELLMDAMAAINARFSSGNSVPVDRAWVTYAEWKNLQFALSLALTPPEGHVVVTRNEAGKAVAVTRQDDEGRILSVIAEFEAPEVDMGNPMSVPDGYVLVKAETLEELAADSEGYAHLMEHRQDRLRQRLLPVYEARSLLAARPEVKP